MGPGDMMRGAGRVLVGLWQVLDVLQGGVGGSGSGEPRRAAPAYEPNGDGRRAAGPASAPDETIGPG